MERAEKSWSLGLFFQLFPSALSVVGSLAFTPDNGDCVRLSPGARFRKIIPKLLRAVRSVLAPPPRTQPPARPLRPGAGIVEQEKLRGSDRESRSNSLGNTYRRDCALDERSGAVTRLSSTPLD